MSLVSATLTNPSPILDQFYYAIQFVYGFPFHQLEFEFDIIIVYFNILLAEFVALYTWIY